MILKNEYRDFSLLSNQIRSKLNNEFELNNHLKNNIEDAQKLIINKGNLLYDRMDEVLKTVKKIDDEAVEHEGDSNCCICMQKLVKLIILPYEERIEQRLFLNANIHYILNELLNLLLYLG